MKVFQVEKVFHSSKLLPGQTLNDVKSIVKVIQASACGSAIDELNFFEKILPVGSAGKILLGGRLGVKFTHTRQIH